MIGLFLRLYLQVDSVYSLQLVARYTTGGLRKAPGPKVKNSDTENKAMAEVSRGFSPCSCVVDQNVDHAVTVHILSLSSAVGICTVSCLLPRASCRVSSGLLIVIGLLDFNTISLLDSLLPPLLISWWVYALISC